jgi:hypothetical protein
MGESIDIPPSLESIVSENAAISIIRYPSAALFVDVYNDGTVGSSILSLSVEGIQSGVDFDPPIELLVEVANVTISTFTCAYYDFAVMSWLSEGCNSTVVAVSSKTTILCACKHLTNFAVLLDHQGIAEI